VDGVIENGAEILRGTRHGGFSMGRESERLGGRNAQKIVGDGDGSDVK
jgi:hypothetical protein